MASRFRSEQCHTLTVQAGANHANGRATRIDDPLRHGTARNGRESREMASRFRSEQCHTIYQFLTAICRLRDRNIPLSFTSRLILRIL